MLLRERSAAFAPRASGSEASNFVGWAGAEVQSQDFCDFLNLPRKIGYETLLWRRLAMTHRRRWYVLLGKAVSVAVQLSNVARHFHTGEELGVTRFSSGLRQGNAMTLVCSRKTGPLFLYLVTSGLLTLHALLKTGLLQTRF
jgi:hypothetical protein